MHKYNRVQLAFSEVEAASCKGGRHEGVDVDGSAQNVRGGRLYLALAFLFSFQATCRLKGLGLRVRNSTSHRR